MRLQITFGFGIGEDKDGLTISRQQQQEALKLIKKEAAQMFGGYTLYGVAGGWINPSGRLVEEDAASLVVYTQDDPRLVQPSQDTDYKIGDMVNIIKTQLNQEAVAVVTTQVEFTIQ